MSSSHSYVFDRDHEFRLLGEGTAQTVVHNNPESSRTVASRLSHSKFRCHVLAFENTVMWRRRVVDPENTESCLSLQDRARRDNRQSVARLERRRNRL